MTSSVTLGTWQLQAGPGALTSPRYGFLPALFSFLNPSPVRESGSCFVDCQNNSATGPGQAGPKQALAHRQKNAKFTTLGGRGSWQEPSRRMLRGDLQARRRGRVVQNPVRLRSGARWGPGRPHCRVFVRVGGNCQLSPGQRRQLPAGWQHLPQPRTWLALQRPRPSGVPRRQRRQRRRSERWYGSESR